MAKKDPKDLPVEDKLKTLYQLQTVLSQIDEKRALRGELPLEVQDLEDEIAGITTRIDRIEKEILEFNEAVNNKRQAEDGLRVQYNQLRYDLATALETYDIQSRNLEVTQRVFNNVAEKYRYGRASSLEVTTASTDIISAQSNYIQAVMSVVSAQISLENLLNN
jgi:predicted  nucleic acid-binding Zn-ribbon protein